MNRFLQKKPRAVLQKNLLLPLLIFLILFAFLLYGLSSVSKSTAREEARSLKQAVIKSAVHCYAAEGNYPESLNYLEENYGITYDAEKYLVIYEVTGSNLMPDISVINLSSGEEVP